MTLLSAAARLEAQAAAQDWEKAAGGSMAFEVASLRPSKPDTREHSNQALSSDSGWGSRGGVLDSEFPVRVFISFAYKLNSDEAQRMQASLPAWAKTQLYDLHAKAPMENATKDQTRLMMQALLKERFGVAVHAVQKDEAVLALVPSKRGSIGPTLRPHAEGPPCDQPVPPGSDVFPASCGVYGMTRKPNHLNRLGSRDTTMALIASMLNNVADLGRPVVDRTGLTGRFDITLEYVPESNTPATNPTVEPAGGPTILEAIREQLGLRLEPGKALLETIVVDHI